MPLDFIPEGKKSDSKNVSGYKKHPKYDFIPDGAAGKKLLAQFKKDKEKGNVDIVHVGDIAYEKTNICKDCGFPAVSKELLEDHIAEEHTEKERVEDEAKVCVGETKEGKPCKNKTVKDSDYCKSHQPE